MKVLHILSLSLLISLSLFAKGIAAISPADKVITDILDKNISYNTSMQNLQALMDKKIDFAIINSDDAYAIKKSSPNLRTLVALYPKMLAFITKKGSNIPSILDLNDKKKACYTSKGTQSLCKKIFSTWDISHKYIHVSFDEAKKQLEQGKVSGILSLEGHPNQDIEQLNKELSITFVPLYGKKFDQLKNDFPFILKGGMPKGVYQGLERDIKSIGIKALLVTREDVNEKMVQTVTQTILENIKDIKKRNFIYRGISKKTLLEGLIFPLHQGAIKAFNAH